MFVLVGFISVFQSNYHYSSCSGFAENRARGLSGWCVLLALLRVYFCCRANGSLYWAYIPKPVQFYFKTKQNDFQT